ncbi:hypothetical protein LZP85_02830 [Priestia flexa]|uniref:Uncharacterized protein n=1 Tax=Priestia flexa TaxID=86664 RepID=A0A8I1SKX8_9BACI|nr:hypothetical protein [Priestia flexa]MBN8251087.1 hypothetical protein [Priestia flexa]UIR30739.1 hypothetical protein LZP85_02830 [Priestia flexa]UZW66376.1 hypothetical protein OC195_21430 [Priestia flexa]
MLLALNPYRGKLFSISEINTLKGICEALLEEYRKGDKQDQDIRRFAKDLRQLCIDALAKGKVICAAGD